MHYYTDLLVYMASYVDEPLHQDTLLGVAWASVVALGACVGICLQLVVSLLAVLLAGATLHSMGRGLRQLGRRSSYGYHAAKLDQAREAGDTAAAEHHAQRVYVLSDQLDRAETEGQ